MITNRYFKILAATSVLLTLCVIVFGAYVRLSNAGLSCPDWPGCYGHLTVPTEAKDIAAANAAFPQRPVDITRAWLEMIHRYAASVLGLIILAMAILAWRHRDIDAMVPTMLFVLVCAQGMLGMLTVTLLLKPIIVTAHLLGGLATLSLCLLLLLRCMSEKRRRKLSVSGLRTFTIAALGVLIIQIFLGGWTSTNYAALACPDFPTCQGAWVPQLELRNALTPWHGIGQNYEGGILSNDARVTIHFLHRVVAIIALITLLAFAFSWIRAARTAQATALGVVLAVLVVAQVAAGIGNVILGLPLLLAVAHNGGAALLLGTLVTMYHVGATAEAARASEGSNTATLRQTPDLAG